MRETRAERDGTKADSKEEANLIAVFYYYGARIRVKSKYAVHAD